MRNRYEITDRQKRIQLPKVLKI